MCQASTMLDAKLVSFSKKEIIKSWETEKGGQRGVLATKHNTGDDVEGDEKSFTSKAHTQHPHISLHCFQNAHHKNGSCTWSPTDYIKSGTWIL